MWFSFLVILLFFDHFEGSVIQSVSSIATYFFSSRGAVYGAAT